MLMTRASIGAAIIIAIGYYLGAKLGFALTLTPVPVSTLWPPNTILLAGLVLTPLRSWPMVLAAVLAAHLAVQFQSGVPTGMVLSWYVSNCLEALLGAAIFRRLRASTPVFDTFRGTALFLVCVGFAVPFVSSFVDAAFVELNGWGDSSYWTVWRTRFFSNVLATLTLGPVIVTTTEHVRRLQKPSALRVAEAVVVLGTLAGICWMVFVVREPGPGTSPALLYAPLPLLVAAAVRLGSWGASASILTCALFAISGAVMGQGPFVTSSAPQNALAIQLFLIVAWIPVMSLSAVIRERAQADANARRSEQELAIAIDAAQLGRWEWDVKAGRLTWSEITRRIYEVPSDAPVSPATFEALIHPDDRPLIAAASAKAITGGEIDVEFRVVFPDGRIKWILSKGRTILDDEGRPARMIGVKVDVTERKFAEFQMHRQQRELAHLSRVAVAGELSSALAHEVNQPLAAILANASAARRFLLHDPPDLRELGEIVEAIAHDNRRAAAVITRFGSLLKKSDQRWTLVDINDVVASVVDVARTDIISRGVSLTKDLGKDLPRFAGDPVQIQQVLLNLIINACDAMESIPAAERRLHLATAEDEEGGVRVTVTDNGVGITADHVDDIFEPFVTSKTQRLGLGLAICRSIVADHDGRLWVENQSGCGAAFSFTLPAASVDAAIAASS